VSEGAYTPQTRVKVHLPFNDQPRSLLDWRSGLISKQTRQAPSETWKEGQEAKDLIREINKTVTARTAEASQIELRLCIAFPQNTICHIGDSIFDCPRPVSRLSIQSPMSEYRRGSNEYSFLMNTFDTLWNHYSVPPPNEVS
jgi:hypothetical protein